jgi:AraC-like DNA-binding protein
LRFLSFTTEGVAPRERYEAWRERPWPSLARMLRATRPEADFYSHSRIFGLGRVVMSDIRMAGQIYERTPALIRADGFDAITINVTLEGRNHGETRSGPFRAGPRSFFVSDMGSPSHLASTNARCVTLTFDRQDITRFVPCIGALQGLVLADNRAARLVDQVDLLTRRLSGMDDAAATSAGEALTAALLSCLDASEVCELPVAAEQARLRAEAEWIIARRFHEPDLDVSRIASLARVSRATLYRAFADGIVPSLQRLRLRKAAEALADPGDRRQVSEIAYAMGFARLDSFSRAFRAAYGCSPREWRAEGLRAGGRLSPAAAPAP